MIRFESNADQVVAHLRTTAERLNSMRPALLRAAIVTQSEALRRIQIGGDPPWAPAYADYGHRLGWDTGNMARSIQVSDGDDEHEVQVGTNVRAELNDFPYAYAFQFGTGVYAGHSEWDQVPRDAKALSWTVGGETYTVRSAHHVGQPGRPFLYFDDALVARIMAILRQFIRTGEDPLEEA